MAFDQLAALKNAAPIRFRDRDAAAPRPPSGKPVKFSGVVTRVRFYNPEEGFLIVKVKGVDVNGKKREIAVKGNAAGEIAPGTQVSCEGAITTYGGEEQITTEFIHEVLPTTKEGIEAYIATGKFPGVGPALAKAIVARYGEKTLEMIDKHPLDLLRVPGMGEKTHAKMMKAWKARAETHQIMAFLATHGVGPGIAARIYRTLGENCIPAVTQNPYLLTTVPMVGFKTADGVAMSLGIEKASSYRIASFIKYLLEEQSTKGHTLFRQSEVVDVAARELEAPIEKVRSVLGAEMASGRDLVARSEREGFRRVPPNMVTYNENDYVSTASMYRAEVSVANNIERLTSPLAKKIAPPLDLANFERLLKAAGMEHLDGDQRQAVRRSLEAKFSVITGGPGCGKTTVTKAIVSIAKKHRQKVLLCAPTGRAARRMEQATGHTANTAHSLLGSRGGAGGFRFNENNPLDVDVLVLDESSMADTYLTSCLLKAIPDHTRVVFVGDANQLPSVGAGNVLNDIIASEAVTTSILTKIHRQAEGNPIIRNSHAIIRGRMPDTTLGAEFLFLEKPAEKIVDTVAMCIRTLMAGDFARHEIQVLAPIKKGPAGTEALNAVAREILNPDVGQPHATIGGTKLRVGDRVMQLKNDSENDISNGDIGHIKAIDAEERELTIDFGDRSVNLAYEDAGHLALAYACTVHKSQGSEFPVVIMPMTASHYTMLNRNIVYTGITRAKERVMLVGESRALKIAVSKRDTATRNTGLIPLLRTASARANLTEVVAQMPEAPAQDFAIPRPDLAAVNF